MRFTLRSLLIAATIGPPLLAALCLEPAYMLAALCYVAVLA